MKIQALLAVVLTYFLDFIGLFMVVPIFAPTFMDSHSSFLPEGASTFIRTMIIGSLAATYGLAQFIGAPILGELSDQWGRKKVMCGGLIFFIAGYVLGAYSFNISSLFLLFLSRFFVGFASGNAAVLFAAVSELSDEKTRGTNMGYLTGAATAGIVIGPFLGSHLIQPSFVSWFRLSTPFWLMAILGIINFLGILIFFQDPRVFVRRSFHPLMGMRNIIDCFCHPALRIVLLSYFFFVLSTESSFVSLPIFTIQKFHATSLYIGYLFLCSSAVSSLTSLFLNPLLSKRVSSYKIFFFSLSLLILLFLSLFIPRDPWWLLLPFGIAGSMMVLCWTHGNVLAGNHAGPDEQGKVLGANQSLLSLSILFGPLVVGSLAAVHSNIALAFSPLSALVSLIFIGKSWYDTKA